MKKTFSEQAGRTMFEAIAYISVAIILTVSIATAVNSGYFRFRIGRMHQQLMDLKKVISQRYVAAENYNEVSFDKLIEEKIVPFELRNQTHAFGGDIKIGPGENDNGETFYIEFQSLPAQSCVELGSILWVVNDGSDLDAMDINDMVWSWDYSSSVTADKQKHKLPARAVDVTRACEGCRDEEGEIIECPEKKLYIRWYFT